MSVKINENIPIYLRGLAQKLDRQIIVLESHGDMSTVFTPDDLQAVEAIGYTEYLAHLQQLRQDLGRPNGTAGE